MTSPGDGGSGWSSTERGRPCSAPDDGDLRTLPDGNADRFLIDAELMGGLFSLVEHRLLPGVLAAPLHRHTQEDEYSFVLEGRIGAVLDGREVVVEAGDLFLKPRDEWHTFWNAGDQPARVLEMISPAGLEALFRIIDDLGDELSPDQLGELARQHRIDVDLRGTAAVAERHGLTF